MQIHTEPQAHSSRQLFGREDQSSVLLQSLVPAGPAVVYVHGIPGVGKTALLQDFAEAARGRGATVLLLDCRSIEPTDRGLLHSLASATGSRTAGLQAVVKRLGALGDRVILALDTYEVFRLLDPWLREVLIPAVGYNVRVVLSGREPPAAAWLASPSPHGAFKAVRLEPLTEPDAQALLTAKGLSTRDVARVSRFARGLPLALTLAAAIIEERPGLGLAEDAFPFVVDSLTRLYLAGIEDPATRHALQASAVVRRLTLSLLAAMLPDEAPRDVFDRLQALPFVRAGFDGLYIHDAVREALAAQLKAVDPMRYRSLRRAAWRQLQSEVRAAGIDELWRYTADLLYLLETPVIREAFFPSGGAQFTVEAAQAAEVAAIEAIIDCHESPSAAALMKQWLARHPETFAVVRDTAGQIVSFHCVFQPQNVDSTLLAADPITRAWCDDLERDPLPPNQIALFVRHILSREAGEMPSPMQAASWLEIKRGYLVLRPRLRRIYAGLRDPAAGAFAQVLGELGFRPLGAVTLGDTYHCAVNDFGPLSVDGWLARLVANELGIESEEILDRGARELVLPDRRERLTRLEYGLISALADHPGEAVSRAVLMEEVWGYSSATSSNVVETVVRSLRRKLGDQSNRIKTVSGVGYMLR